MILWFWVCEKNHRAWGLVIEKNYLKKCATLDEFDKVLSIFFCWFTKVIVFLNIVPLEETTKHATHMGGMTKHGSVTKRMCYNTKTYLEFEITIIFRCLLELYFTMLITTSQN
jgi:hypothetical protein